MALTSSAARSMCNKMVYDFDGQIAPAQAAKSTMKNNKNELQKLLNNLTSSTQTAIDDGIEAVTGDMNGVIPASTLSDMRALKDFIEECEYLSGLSPIAAMLGAIDSIYSKLDQFIDNIGATVPEFNIAKIASKINDLLGARGPNLSDRLKWLDKLINCIESYCGGEFPDQLSNMSTALGQAYTDLNITSDPLSSNYGLFDFSSLYTTAGLTTPQITKVNQVRDFVDGEKDRTVSTINSAIDVYKGNFLI